MAIGRLGAVRVHFDHGHLSVSYVESDSGTIKPGIPPSARQRPAAG
jgi:hypothetical protein